MDFFGKPPDTCRFPTPQQTSLSNDSLSSITRRTGPKRESFAERIKSLPLEKTSSPQRRQPSTPVIDTNKSFFDGLAARLNEPPKKKHKAAIANPSKLGEGPSHVGGVESAFPVDTRDVEGESLVTRLEGVFQFRYLFINARTDASGADEYAQLGASLMEASTSQLEAVQKNLEAKLAQIRLENERLLKRLGREDSAVTMPLSDSQIEVHNPAKTHPEKVRIGDRVAQTQAKLEATERELEVLWTD